MTTSNQSFQPVVNQYGVSQISQDDPKPTKHEIFRYYTTLEKLDSYSYRHIPIKYPIIRVFQSQNTGLKTDLKDNPKNAWKKLSKVNRNNLIKTNDINISSKYIQYFSYRFFQSNIDDKAFVNFKKYVSIGNNKRYIIYLFLSQVKQIVITSYINGYNKNDFKKYVNTLSDSKIDTIFDQLFKWQQMPNTEYFVFEVKNVKGLYDDDAWTPSNKFSMNTQYNKDFKWDFIDYGYNNNAITYINTGKPDNRHRGLANAIFINKKNLDQSKLIKINGLYNSYNELYNILLNNGNDIYNPSNNIRLNCKALDDRHVETVIQNDNDFLKTLNRFIDKRFWVVDIFKNNKDVFSGSMYNYVEGY